MLSEEDTSLENSSVKIPSWVIYFVVLLFVISVFGFIYFHRFSKSVHYYKLSIKTFQENDLEAAEDQVEHDAHAAADHAVAVPHSLLVRIVMKKKPRQKSDHTASSFERSWFKV